MNHKWNKNTCTICHITRQRIAPNPFLVPTGHSKPITPQYMVWQYITPAGAKQYKRPDCYKPINLVESVTNWLQWEQKHLEFLLKLQAQKNIPSVAEIIRCTEATINEYHQFLINQ